MNLWIKQIHFFFSFFFSPELKELYNLGETLEKEFTKDLTKEEYKELLNLLDKMMKGINK